eukprot:TRINITY_DN8940_c0_g1_i1.p1 TRINITY_DN8940_c0_g1~~TRINITY_DN8940_c0_g1_i1.p1  ORF type:complete len:577 (-),score=162.08 TRINITY_DN8940_c0_g1_i1:308-2038(-)
MRNEEDRYEKPLPLIKGKYGVGISWDVIPNIEVDLDLQCVICDKRGMIVDAVYYNNLRAMNGLIGHTGDEASGEMEGFDEIVWMQLHKLPVEVQLIIFIVATYDGGCLMNARNTKISLLEQSSYKTVHTLNIDPKPVDVCITGLFERTSNDSWQYQVVHTGISSGSHFLDILEPNLGDIIRSKIYGAPKVQEVSFEMEKGAMTDFPNKSLKRLAIGIGAELAFRGNSNKRMSYVQVVNAKVDIDISAEFYDKNKKHLGMVDGRTESMYGVSHSGDNLAGTSKAQGLVMDDEAIQVDFASVPDKITEIFVFLTVRNGNFENIASAYARVCDQSCRQLAKFSVQGGSKNSGLLIGRIVREPGQRWGFQAIGKFFAMNKKASFVQKFLDATEKSKKPKKAALATDADPSKKESGETVPTETMEKSPSQSLPGDQAAGEAITAKLSDPVKRASTSARKIQRMMTLAMAAKAVDSDEECPKEEDDEAGDAMLPSKSITSQGEHSISAVDLESPERASSKLTRGTEKRHTAIKRGTGTLTLEFKPDDGDEQADEDRCRPCKACGCSTTSSGDNASQVGCAIS